MHTLAPLPKRSLLVAPLPKRSLLAVAMAARTLDEWKARLRLKPLTYLYDQVALLGWNGCTHDRALLQVIEEKEAQAPAAVVRGNAAPKTTTSTRGIVVDDDDDDDMVVEHVPFGPKGQTLRVKVPRNMYTS